MATGSEIHIEERASEEVTSIGGTAIAPRGAHVYNPAFDVTPGHLVTAFITEYGVMRPPYLGDNSGACRPSELRRTGRRALKFYDFIDKAPKLGSVVVIEGTERVARGARARSRCSTGCCPPTCAISISSVFRLRNGATRRRVREAVQAMPFLADRRVVVVTDAQALKAQPRRDLLEVAQNVPDGNTLVILDLLSPRVAAAPSRSAALLGRAALRIDTTANEEARSRFVNGTARGARGDGRAAGRSPSLTRSEAELAAVRNDLEKLALGGKKITYKDLEGESLAVEDPKAYLYASAAR